MDPYPPSARRRGLLRQRFRHHGIYWLPNLITSGAMFAGFYAIVQGMTHEYERAAVAIFVAMVLDAKSALASAVTQVRMRDYTDEEIAAFIATWRPFERAPARRASSASSCSPASRPCSATRPWAS